MHTSTITEFPAGIDPLPGATVDQPVEVPASQFTAPPVSFASV